MVWKISRAFAAFTTNSGKSVLTNAGLRKEVLEGEVGYPECTFKGTESSQNKNQLKWVMISPSRCISIFSNHYYSCWHLKKASLLLPQLGPPCHLLPTNSCSNIGPHNHTTTKPFSLEKTFKISLTTNSALSSPLLHHVPKCPLQVSF